MKNTIKNNQQGMASIMFAMFLVLGISLLAIGFATLVRNDQRQALDKTLSNQAQYAAESAINKIQNDIKNKSITESYVNGCNKNDNTNPTFNSSGISVTCLNWDMELDSILHNSLGTVPWSTNFNTTSPINSIKISWQPGEGNNSSNFMSGPQTSLKLNNNDMPTIRVVLAKATDVSNAKVAYLSPTNQNSNVAIQALTVSGVIGNASCDSATKSCSIVIDTTSLLDTNNLLAISSLNGLSNVQVQAFNGANGNNQQKITGAQAKITANAKSQDVSKRLVAYVSLPTSTWQPGFVASADALCKNYKLGLGVNDQAGPVTDTLCPTN